MKKQKQMQMLSYDYGLYHPNFFSKRSSRQDMVEVGDSVLIEESDSIKVNLVERSNGELQKESSFLNNFDYGSTLGENMP